MGNPISRLRNGLKIDGHVNTDGSIDVITDKDGNIVVGFDTNGNFQGKAFAPRTQSVTATDDGLTTGIIKDNIDHVTVTSAGATKAVTLPVASAATIGRKLTIYVGSNGYELLSGADAQTINTADSDGTNQLDVAASSVLHLIQVSASGWYAFQQTASALSIVAPDND